MSKIIITEEQAKNLGLTELQDYGDYGTKKGNNFIGATIRVVISGEGVPTYKDEILAVAKKIDKTSDLKFYEVTGKIVGNLQRVLVEQIIRNIYEIKDKKTGSPITDKDVVVHDKPTTNATQKQHGEKYWFDRQAPQGLNPTDSKDLDEEGEDSGLKGVRDSDRIIRIAVSGPTLIKYKDRVLQLIMRQDPEAKVNYFEATGKIVGSVKFIKLESIQRDIKLLDPTITVEKSDPSKKLVKITKEQYNRIFADNVITESDVTGGLTRVDKTFKKSFSGKNVQNLKPVAEDKFNITKPNKDIPKLSKNIGNAKAPITEGEDEIKKETLEFLKYLYRKSEELSPYWEKHGLNYEKICDALKSKNIVIDKGGKYELSKKLGSPQAAKQALEDTLRELVQPEAEPQAVEEKGDNYPAGADADPNAPWNQKGPDIREPKTPKKIELTPLTTNYDISILKAPDGTLYCFHFAFKDKEEFAEYAPVTRHYVGKDEEGVPEYEYDTNFDVDNDVISNYVNDKLETLTKGEGMTAWNEGIDLVKIDEPVKHEILSMFDKDKGVVKALGGITETDAIDKFKSGIKKNFTPPPEPSIEEPEAKKSRIVKKLQDLKARETERVEKEKTDNTKSWETGDVDEITNAAKKANFGDMGENSVEEETVGKAISPENAILFDVEDRSWWSDRYKEVNGFRPTNMSEKELIDWANSNFILKGNKLINILDPKGEVYEMTGSASAGAFTPALGTSVVKREMPETPVVGETTVAGAGHFQYDANALPNIKRDGTFVKGNKTKAEKTPQWAGGSFVKQPNCSKLNNNKEAQNGGCNQGASSLNLAKGKGSINAPSLAEGIDEKAIYEEIAKQTGKSISEIETIIKAKKG